MEAKKNPKIDENKRVGTFRNLGFTISALAVIIAFEMPSRGNQEITDLGQLDADFEELLEIPPTTQPPPPPPKVQIPEIVEIPDDEEIEEQVEVELDVEVIEETTIEEFVFTEAPEEEKTEEVLTIVEHMPEFPGGKDAFKKFLSKNLKYPKIARRMGIEGRVYVEFVVAKDGSLDDMRVVKGVGAGCDEEAYRVMSLVPKFNPGKQRGNPVPVRMIIPIFFRLNS